jgi:hypothetical protein
VGYIQTPGRRALKGNFKSDRTKDNPPDKSAFAEAMAGQADELSDILPAGFAYLAVVAFFEETFSRKCESDFVPSCISTLKFLGVRST